MEQEIGGHEEMGLVLLVEVVVHLLLVVQKVLRLLIVQMEMMVVFLLVVMVFGTVMRGVLEAAAEAAGSVEDLVLMTETLGVEAAVVPDLLL